MPIDNDSLRKAGGVNVVVHWPQNVIGIVQTLHLEIVGPSNRR